MSQGHEPSGAARFDHPVHAANADVDGNGHVNNVVYLRWVQEAAVAHWRAVTIPEDRAGVAWVVVRHEIDYKKPAYAGDALVARTWVEQVTAATTERWCEILRGDAGEMLARSRTVWCAVDPRTGKPRRIDGRIRSYFAAGSAATAASARP
jgi:acyl-CoA thioester hydrolase